MPQTELFLLFVRLFNLAQFRHVIGGSVAAIFYGEPRMDCFREGGSDKHLRDIRGMLSVSGEQIDRADLLAWVQRQVVQAEWRKVTEI